MGVTRVEIDAPAKVNLWLRVLAREESGFHGLETLFCSIGLCDRIRVERGGRGIHLEQSGEVEMGPPDENLAVRAARLALRTLGREGEGVRVGLHKRIPAAAGLGGGSSDAAAVLRAVNMLYGESLSGETLLRLGSQLGSDVPFFLCGSTLALGWNRGERLLELPPLPSLPVLIAHPREPMPTGSAFARIAELRGGNYQPDPRVLNLGSLADWKSVAALAMNDFEPVASERVPRVPEGLAVMRAAEARLALLAGSGASIFGVFDNDGDLERAEAEVREVGFTTWSTRTLARPRSPDLLG